MGYLPSPPADVVNLTLVGRVFTFRRLTWRDEILFAQQNPSATRLDYAIHALLRVDDHVVTPDQARVILEALPKPLSARVVVLYMGSLPEHRDLQADIPYAAPEPTSYQEAVDDETEALLREEDEALERRFGAEDVAESKALALQMAEGTNYAGVTRPLEPDAPTPAPNVTDGGVDEEPPRYHALVL